VVKCSRVEALCSDIARLSALLASFDNYYLTRKNARFDLIIWHGHLWGGTFHTTSQSIGSTGFPACAGAG